MDKETLERALGGYEKWLIFFGIFVAIGVAGESVFGLLNYRKSGELDQIRKTENLTLQKQVTDAQAELAQTNTRLLEEQRRLGDTCWRLERVERGVLPRAISDEQIQIILERLRRIPNLETVNVVAVDTTEDLTTQVVQLLQQVGAMGCLFSARIAPRGTLVYRANAAGNELAKAFWEVTARYFGGVTSVRAATGFEPLPEH
jgi:hypothetical protein